MRDEKQRVLIVEDYFVTLELLCFVFKARGYYTQVAKDGEEAVSKSMEERPHLIIMDVHLPRMNGLLAARLIRGHETTAHIPIIAMSAVGSREMKTSALVGGCDAYFDKPLDPSHLLTVAETLMNNSKQFPTFHLADKHKMPGVRLCASD